MSTAMDRPFYDTYRQMSAARAPLAAAFARQALETTRPYLAREPGELSVLDVGSGYGHTAIELARKCRDVVGIEPSAALFTAAEEARQQCGLGNVTFRQQSIYELRDAELYDLV